MQAWQVSAGNAHFKGFDGRVLRCRGFGFAPADFGRLKSQNFFGFVDFLVLQAFQTADFIYRQIGINAQTFSDFGIADITEILIIIIGGQLFFVNPNGITLRFAHFFAV